MVGCKVPTCVDITICVNIEFWLGLRVLHSKDIMELAHSLRHRPQSLGKVNDHTKLKDNILMLTRMFLMHYYDVYCV